MIGWIVLAAYGGGWIVTWRRTAWYFAHEFMRDLSRAVRCPDQLPRLGGPMPDEQHEEAEVYQLRSFQSLLDEPYKRWYQFGWGSLGVLWRRFRYKHQPIAMLRHRWQRSRRGWSDRDIWSFDYYLATTIRDAVRHWLTWPPSGHPGDGETYEQWLHFLGQIADGMDAYIQYAHGDLPDDLRDEDGVLRQEAISAHVEAKRAAWDNGGRQKYERAMDLLKEYLPAMWD